MKRLFAVLFIFAILFHVSACKAERKESHQPTEQSFTEPENYEGSSPVVSENSFSAFGDTLEFQLFEKTEFYELTDKFTVRQPITKFSIHKAM